MSAAEGKRYYPVAELIDAGRSLSMRFFTPTRWEWIARLKLLAYRARYWFSEMDVEARIVDAERAAYLIVSYQEWVLRRRIDAAT
jgi:hypothetical protein